MVWGKVLRMGQGEIKPLITHSTYKVKNVPKKISALNSERWSHSTRFYESVQM